MKAYGKKRKKLPCECPGCANPAKKVVKARARQASKKEIKKNTP